MTSNKKKTILLVEDDSSDEKLTLLAFKRCGVPSDVIVARDGAAALDWLFATGAHEARDPNVLPAIILLDLKVPKIDGLECLRRIRAHDRTRYVPVVILTSSREEADIVNSYALGANGYTRKSVDFTEFAVQAEILGRFWLTLNEPFPSYPSPASSSSIPSLPPSLPNSSSRGTL